MVVVMIWIDYLVVALFLMGLLVMGFFLSKRAGKNTDEFILAGRRLPWWLAGTSMAATGLNASTMLQDSRKIRQDGIAGMWFTWAAVVGAIIQAIWFIRLWRRGRFVTQMEFYHARYRGWPATFARVYDSIIYGVFVSVVWASVGIVGMRKIVNVLFDFPATIQILGFSASTDLVVVLVLIGVTLIYSAASGVYGVVWTDLIEFFIALFCSYMLLFMVFGEVGWNSGLQDKLHGLGEEGDRILQIFPEFGLVLLYFFIIGPIVGQGGYNPHIQRYLGVKDEREVIVTVIYNAVLNFVIKSWPFYILGLVGIFVISDAYLLQNFDPIYTPEGEAVADYEKVFPALATKYLPAGFLGLMIAGFLAAFMSSFDTNIHNSSSIVINDLYRPYLVKGKSPRHYVSATRWFLVLITVLAGGLGILANDILTLTMVAMTIMKTAGIVKLLRFIWWRTNGRSEVVAQVVAVFTTAFWLSPWGEATVVWLMNVTGQSGNDPFFVYRLILMMGGSSIAAILVIAFGKPEPMDHLCEFYRRMRPFGFWGPVRKACGDDVEQPDSILLLSLLTFGGISLVYGLMFTVLGLFLAFYLMSLGAFLMFLIGSAVTILVMRKMYPNHGREHLTS